MTGEIKGRATVETEHGDYTLTLRFVDWERPDHRNTEGYAIPRYSLQVEAPDGAKESFTGWGSIAEAREQELHHTDALSWMEDVARDGLVFYEELDGTHELLERNLTAAALTDDMADMVDNLAAEFGIENPSEAVRALGAHMDTARKLKNLGLDYHSLHDFYSVVRDEIEA